MLRQAEPDTLYVGAEEGNTRALLHRLLKDEVRHAQVGWAHLGEEARLRDCAFVADHLAEMLDISVRDAVFLAVREEDSGASLRHGVLPVGQRREQFCRTLDEVVVPGFAHFGVDTSAMTVWRDHKLELHP